MRVVRHARWLGRVPALPQFFDALTQMVVALTDRPRLRAMREIEQEVVEWNKVTCGIHRFGGVEFRIDGREFAHLHSCGLLDAIVGRTHAQEWVAQGKAIPHHVFGESKWVSYWVRTEDDVAGAQELLKYARDLTRNNSRGKL